MAFEAKNKAVIKPKEIKPIFDPSIKNLKIGFSDWSDEEDVVFRSHNFDLWNTFL